jgi:hypothetical protein
MHLRDQSGTQRITVRILSDKAVVAAFVLCSFASSAHAQVITDRTPCKEFVAAMDSQQREGIHPFLQYVFGTMLSLDTMHIHRGEQSMMLQLSDEGRDGMAAMTSTHCRSHPSLTVHDSATYVYQATRELQSLLGK